MTPLEQIESLAAETSARFPTARTSVTAFPSGAANLDVWHVDRIFVVAYFPSYHLYCVDELGDEVGLGTWYRFGYPDIASAHRQLFALMEGPSTLPAWDEFGRPLMPRQVSPPVPDDTANKTTTP